MQCCKVSICGYICMGMYISVGSAVVVISAQVLFLFRKLFEMFYFR